MFFLILGNNTVNIFVQHRHLSNDMRKVYILEPFIFPCLVQQIGKQYKLQEEKL